MTGELLTVFCAFAAALGFWIGFQVGRSRRRKPVRGKPSMEPIEGSGNWLAIFPDGTQYKGNCDVWHRFPSGKRASTNMESRLCDEWQAAKWRLGKDD